MFDSIFDPKARFTQYFFLEYVLWLQVDVASAFFLTLFSFDNCCRNA